MDSLGCVISAPKDLETRRTLNYISLPIMDTSAFVELAPNDPRWDELLKEGNEKELYEYTKRYYERQKDVEIAGRDAMPIVRRIDIGDGVTETVRIYFNWLAHNELEPIFRKYLEETNYIYANRGWGRNRIFECGKLHYIWSKDGEEISCVNIFALYGLDERVCWETCHPPGRYLTVDEARERIRKYFKNPKSKEFQ
jgi:hypothetical protein